MNYLSKFEKTHLFWMLDSRGFGSMINHILYALHFCKAKKMNMVLLSQPSYIFYKYALHFCKAKKMNMALSEPFSLFYKKGIEDYFVIENFAIAKPFRLNKYSCYYYYYYYSIFFKKFFNTRRSFYFSWDMVRSFEHELMIKNKKQFILEISQILKIFWKLNKNTKDEINKRLKEFPFLNLPYSTIHIRRGDKITSGEAKEYELSIYVEELLSASDNDIVNIFVMTDDYRVYTELVFKYPQYKFFTFCNEEALGYVQGHFNKLPKYIKKETIISLLTDIEIAKKGEFFVGDYHSNIYRLIEYFNIVKCSSIVEHYEL